MPWRNSGHRLLSRQHSTIFDWLKGPPDQTRTYLARRFQYGQKPHDTTWVHTLKLSQNILQSCYCNGAGAAKNCKELYERGLEDNAFVTIDADGADGRQQPFTAYCQRNGTTAYTIIRTSFVHVLSLVQTPIGWTPPGPDGKPGKVIGVTVGLFTIAPNG